MEVVKCTIVNITEAAAEWLATLIADDGREGLRLRLSLQGRALMVNLDNRNWPGDIVDSSNGIAVVVNCAHIDLLVGTTIGFVQNGDEVGLSFYAPRL